MIPRIAPGVKPLRLGFSGAPYLLSLQLRPIHRIFEPVVFGLLLVGGDLIAQRVHGIGPGPFSAIDRDYDSQAAELLKKLSSDISLTNPSQ
jgi:hypothetical protein